MPSMSVRWISSGNDFCWRTLICHQVCSLRMQVNTSGMNRDADALSMIAVPGSLRWRSMTTMPLSTISVGPIEQGTGC